MAGHSKWKQIKHYKAATDAKRGALFTRLIREITVAARSGGGDPGGNPRLRTAIDTAKAASMPKENIERAIKKGTGELEGETLSEVVYEGYGPSGVAIIVEAVSDNPNRTVAEIRHKFSRGGGNLGATNSVAWMFDRKGQILIDGESVTEERAMELALEAGAEDLVNEDGSYVVTTDPASFHSVRSALDTGGAKIAEAELAMLPRNTVRVGGSDAAAVLKLIESLEDLDDVQKVWANFDIDEAELATA
jgi:YebC/PmpR family DNA-binding regulatory protein